MIDQFSSQVGRTQGFQRSAANFRFLGGSRVSMCVKATIVIVGALMALAI